MPEFRAVKRDGIIKPIEGFEKEYESIPEDVVISVKVTNPRSKKHQGLFFAAIKCAFYNWPEKHDFIPENEEHLRQWLESKAGYRIALTVAITEGKGFFKNLSAAIAHAQGSGRRQKYVFMTNTATDVYVIAAQSIAYDKLSQEDFNTVSERVSEVLKEHTGLGIDEYKMQFGSN